MFTPLSTKNKILTGIIAGSSLLLSALSGRLVSADSDKCLEESNKHVIGIINTMRSHFGGEVQINEYYDNNVLRFREGMLPLNAAEEIIKEYNILISGAGYKVKDAENGYCYPCGEASYKTIRGFLESGRSFVITDINNLDVSFIGGAIRDNSKFESLIFDKELIVMNDKLEERIPSSLYVGKDSFSKRDYHIASECFKESIDMIASGGNFDELLLPQAQYLFGRTSEEMGDAINAKSMYNKVLEYFGESGFAIMLRENACRRLHKI